MGQSSSNKKVAHSLVAAGTAAVLAVYAAGYTRTQSAADKLDAQSAERRPGAPEGRGPAATGVESRPITPRGSVDAPAEPIREARANIVSPQVQAQAPAPVHETIATSEVSKPEVAVAPPTPVAVVTPQPAAAMTAPSAPIPSVAVAPAVPPPAPVVQPTPAAPPAPKYKDGSYTGWGTSRHGDIQAEVIIEGGRIVSANIAQCLTRYSCNIIGRLPPEVPQRQSAEVDYVSGATQSTNAYYYAVTEALGKAK